MMVHGVLLMREVEKRLHWLGPFLMEKDLSTNKMERKERKEMAKLAHTLTSGIKCESELQTLSAIFMGLCVRVYYINTNIICICVCKEILTRC